MLQKLSDFAKVMPRDLNKIIDAVNRVGDIQATAPLEVTRNAGRVQIRISDQGFQAVVTTRKDNRSSQSSSSSASSGTVTYYTHWVYTITEVQPEPGGLWASKTNGRVVTATEWNDLEVATNTIVWAEPCLNGEWRFFNDGAGLVDSSSSSSGSSGSSLVSCLEVLVPSLTCVNGSITYNSKFISISNGQLVVSDTPCGSSGSGG